MFHEERQVWSYLSIAQAAEDWEQKWHEEHPGTPEGMAIPPCYEYRFSNAARLMFLVDLPAALLIGLPHGCPQSVLALATGALKPRTPVISVRTGAILSAILIVLAICVQWWLIGQWLDRRRKQLKPIRLSILPVAVITACGIVMLPTVFSSGLSAAEWVNIFSGMLGILAWLLLLVGFAVVGIQWLVRKLLRQSAPVTP
jgi:hypothetical protein